MNLKLKELREARGLTVAMMIDRLGVQDSRYRKWESERAAIPLEYAMQCCSILGCTLDELAGRLAVQLSAEENELLALYRDANTQGREAIMAVARASSGVEGNVSDSMSA